MKNRNKPICSLLNVYVVALCSLIVTTSGEAQMIKHDDIKTRLQHMDKVSEAERDILFKDVSNELRDIQGVLLQELGSKNDDVKFHAAYILGEYRFEQAVDSLSQVITMEDKRPVSIQKSEQYRPRFPAAHALIRIGNPSVPAMIRNLECSADEKVQKLSLLVIIYIDGEEVAQAVLKSAIGKQDNPEKKAKLQLVLETVASGKYTKLSDIN